MLGEQHWSARGFGYGRECVIAAIIFQHFYISIFVVLISCENDKVCE